MKESLKEQRQFTGHKYTYLQIYMKYKPLDGYT